MSPSKLPVRILRISVPVSLLSEYDELDLDYLQACGHERFLRREGSRLASVPFVADGRYAREVLDYLRDLTPDLRVTDITNEYEFFEVAGVPPAFFNESFIVIIEKPKPDSGASTLAIHREEADAQIEMYRLHGGMVRPLDSGRGSS